jgi:hypothetical protein
VGPGQDLDRLGQVAVVGHWAVVVPVGAHQIGQHLGVRGIGLGPRQAVPIAVAADRQRVDRIDLVAGRDERAGQQPTVGLDPDHHLPGHLGMLADQLVQPSDPGQVITDPAPGQDAAILGQDTEVMVSLGPIDPNEQHRRPPRARLTLIEPEKTHAALMAVLNGTTSHHASRPSHQPAGAHASPRTRRSG